MERRERRWGNRPTFSGVGRERGWGLVRLNGATSEGEREKRWGEGKKNKIPVGGLGAGLDCVLLAKCSSNSLTRVSSSSWEL